MQLNKKYADEKYKYAKIAKELNNGRTNVQIRIRLNQGLNKSVIKGKHFTSDEGKIIYYY